MADRSIVVRLKAEVGDLKRGFAQAQQATQEFGKRTSDAITRNEQHINTLSNSAGALGLVMVGAAALAVKSYADFDQAMSNVQASTMESAENMALLRDAALEAGERTVYSATEAAGAVEALAKAGVSTADILSGGLDGALDLAAAGTMDVGEAAEIAASAMTQFGLAGDEVTHVADLLAAGAGKAQGEVSDFGAALNQSGLVAAQMGLSIEETVGSLTAFASAGLVGSDAGTSFRAMLLRLANPTNEAREEMQKLGLSLYDAQGDFVGVESLAGQLQDRLGGLTQEQRNATLALIFGQDAIRTSAILYEQGAEGVREWTDAVDEQGYAAEVAAKRLDNLKGDIEQLGGSFETAMIRMGSTGDGPLRTIVQSATDVVNALSEMPPAAQGALLGITGAGGLVLLGVAGLGKLVISVNEAKTAFAAMGRGAKLAGGLATAGLAAATVAFVAYASAQADARARTQELLDTLDEFGRTTDATIESLNRTLAAPNQVNLWEQLFGGRGSRETSSAFELAEKLKIATDDVTLAILGQADAQERVNAALREAREGEGLLDAQTGKDVAALTLIIEEQQRALEDSTTEKQRAEAADRALSDQADEVAAAYEETTAAIEEQENALRDLIDAMAEAAGIVSSAMEAESEFQAAIDDVTASVEANGATLNLNTQQGRDNQAALLGIKDAGYEVIAAMEANGATQDELQGSMQRTRDEFIRAAGAMGLSAEEANALADELGLIPTNVKTTVTVQDNASSSIAGILYQLDRLPNSRTVTVNTLTKETTVTSGRGNQIAKAAGGFISGPGTSTSDSIPARLSNGEYVVKASAVQQYGKAFFDDLNAQRFATGGFVGSRAAVGAGVASMDAGPVAEAVRAAMAAFRPVVQIAGRDFYGLMQETTERFGAR